MDTKDENSLAADFRVYKKKNQGEEICKLSIICRDKDKSI